MSLCLLACFRIDSIKMYFSACCACMKIISDLVKRMVEMKGQWSFGDYETLLVQYVCCMTSMLLTHISFLDISINIVFMIDLCTTAGDVGRVIRTIKNPADPYKMAQLLFSLNGFTFWLEKPTSKQSSCSCSVTNFMISPTAWVTGMRWIAASRRSCSVTALEDDNVWI